jgi:hypothetical protein
MLARWIASVFVTFAFACTSASAAVTIKRQAPVVEQKAFDPADPPKEMPHLNQGEAAVTESVFKCGVSTTYHVVERHPQDGKCESVLKIDGLELTLQLHITIWLPEKAPQKLAGHEEGHRRMAERIYRESAESTARAAAEKLNGRQIKGTGSDCDAASTAALNDADTRLCQEYLNQIGGMASRLGDIYDEITAHGTRLSPAEDEAIAQSFDRYAKEQKSGQPERPDANTPAEGRIQIIPSTRPRR